MSTVKPGPRWPGMKEEPREIGPCAAAPQPDESKLETVCSHFNNQEDFLATAVTEPVGIWPEERTLDLSVSRIDGWVAGVPVVDGVADSGWVDCEGGRVRFVVHVCDSPEQREWVRAMSYGGAYAKEVLGQAA